MTAFRKKPVVVEAVPVAEVLAAKDGNLAPQLPAWVLDALDDSPGNVATVTFAVGDEEIAVHTSEGVMVGNFDDWLIRGVAGELYPCKPDIFEASYEPPGVSKSDEAIGLVGRALTALGDGYRADWSDFDGRQLRDELEEARALLDRAQKGDDVVAEATTLAESWGVEI